MNLGAAIADPKVHKNLSRILNAAKLPEHKVWIIDHNDLRQLPPIYAAIDSLLIHLTF